jgi:outer membrane protein assembly factor BamB
VPTDGKISRATLAKPGFTNTWKVKLDNTARQTNAVTPSLVMTGYIGYRGFRSLGFLSGSSDKIYGVEIDVGRVEWQKSIPGATASAGTAACPGGVSSNVARPVVAGFPSLTAQGGRGGGGGRANAAKSDAGAPGEGAPILKQIEELQAAAAARRGANAPPNAAGPGRGGRGPGGERPRRQPNYVYALGADGMLHGMYVSNGEEPEPAIKFLGPNANAQGLLIMDNIAYTVTSGGCGNVADGVWALDLESKQVASYAAKTAGSAGIAFGGDGTVYLTTTGGDLVALEPKTLKVKDVYGAKQEFTTSPVVFQYKDKALIAAATKDGNIHVLDAASLKAPLSAPASASAIGGALSSWQDTDGSRWILAPTASAVSAWKLVDQNGAPTLQKGWTSRDITSPITPIVVNGVVFAASSGQRGTPSVLYALDGATGKELWNSGKMITSFVPRNGGLSGGGTQVFLGTHDGTIYAFGFPVEH